MRFRRVWFQTPNSVSFWPLPSFGERAQCVPLGLLLVCFSELTEFFFAELTEFAAELCEFSSETGLSKQYSARLLTIFSIAVVFLVGLAPLGRSKSGEIRPATSACDPSPRLTHHHLSVPALETPFLPCVF